MVWPTAPTASTAHGAPARAPACGVSPSGGAAVTAASAHGAVSPSGGAGGCTVRRHVERKEATCPGEPSTRGPLHPRHSRTCTHETPADLFTRDTCRPVHPRHMRTCTPETPVDLTPVGLFTRDTCWPVHPRHPRTCTPKTWNVIGSYQSQRRTIGCIHHIG